MNFLKLLHESLCFMIGQSPFNESYSGPCSSSSVQRQIYSLAELHVSAVSVAGRRRRDSNK